MIYKVRAVSKNAKELQEIILLVLSEEILLALLACVGIEDCDYQIKETVEVDENVTVKELISRELL